MANKIYHIASTHRGHTRIYSCTMDKLLTKVFGYTLSAGNSWNNKIPIQPKTGKSLVKALNDSSDVLNRWSDYYDLVSDEEFETVKQTKQYHGSGVVIDEVNF